MARAAAPANETRKTPRKRRPKAREELVGYVVSVKGWDYHYSYAPADPKSRIESGTWSELAILTFRGTVIRPEEKKGWKTEATLSATQGMLEETGTTKPTSIGTLNSSGDELYAYAFIPAERMPELVSVAQSGRVRTISFAATRLRYRSARLLRISVDTEPYEDEALGDTEQQSA